MAPFQIGDIIAFKIQSKNKYVKMNLGSGRLEHSDKVGDWEKFEVVDGYDGRYGFYNHTHKRFIKLDREMPTVSPVSGVILNGRWWWERYDIIDLGNNDVAIYNPSHRRYMTYGKNDSHMKSVHHPNTPNELVDEVFKVIMVKKLTNKQKEINKRIKTGEINDEEAICYINRYSDLKKHYGTLNYVKGKKHWYDFGRWERRNPMCDNTISDDVYSSIINKTKQNYNDAENYNEKTDKIDIASAQKENEKAKEKLQDTNDLLYTNYEPFNNRHSPKSVIEGMGLYDLIDQKQTAINTSAGQLGETIDNTKQLNDVYITLNDSLYNAKNLNDALQKVNTVSNTKYIQQKATQLMTIEAENMFLDNELSKRESELYTYEQKSFYQNQEQQWLQFMNKYILFYVYLTVAVVTLIYLLFDNSITNFYKVLYLLIIVLYPFFIYPIQRFFYYLWSFIYALIYGIPHE